MVSDLKILGILEALKKVGGYFVWPVLDDEFVLMRKRDFDDLSKSAKEVQLGFDVEGRSEDEIDDGEDYLDQFNHLAVEPSDFEEFGVLGMNRGEDQEPDTRGRTKVRFESIKGDLPPELQE